MQLGQSIAIDRRRLGLSQQELAARLGVSQQSVSKWEEGHARPRGKRLAQLVGALGGTTSHTAALVAPTMPAHNNEAETTVGQLSTAVTQAQALIALAQAAQEIARVAGYEPGGRGFESCRARQKSKGYGRLT